MTITRHCKGKFAAIVFLDKMDLDALRRLLDAYVVTCNDDPDLPRLKNLLKGLQG